MTKSWLILLFILPSLLGEETVDEESVLLETLVITAEKRDGQEVEIPRSLSVQRGDTLREQGLTDIKSISASTINLQVEQFSSSRLSFPYIRGIGAGQGNPAVTTNIDGIPQLSNNSSSLHFSNLERVEFLRGPQGTLYGRNALGGVMNIYTRSPGKVRKTQFSLGGGSDDFMSGELSLELPLSENTSLGLDFAMMDRDGYTTNTSTNHTVDDKEMRHGRVKLEHNYHNWMFRLSWIGQKDRDGALPLDRLTNLQANPHRVTLGYEGLNHRDVSLPSLTMKGYWENFEFVSLTSVGSWKIEDDNDVDFGFGFSSTRKVVEEQDEFYQELRFNSVSSPSPLSWVIGVSYFTTEFEQKTEDDNAFQPAPATTSSDLKSEGLSFFTQVDYDFAKSWTLGLGLRYEDEENQADQANVKAVQANPFNVVTFSDKRSDDAVLPRASLAKRLNDESVVYMSATRGFRAGGYNPVVAAQAQGSYDQEKSWSYELGYKARYSLVDLNLSLFKIDWEDMQLYLSSPVNSSIFYLDNIGEAESQGAEVELSYSPTAELSLNFGLGFIDATFKNDFTDPNDLANGNYEGNDLPQAPSHNWSVSVDHRAKISQVSLLTYGGVEGVGSYAYDHTNSVKQDSFEKVHLGFKLYYQGWSLGGRVDNLLDEETVPLAFMVAPTIYVGESAAPRTFKFQLGARF